MNYITFTRINTMKKKWFKYKKQKLFLIQKIETYDYQYESEEEEKEEKQQHTSKKLDKKEPPKKLTKDDISRFNEWVNRKEIGINSEISQKHFCFQRPSDMLKAVYLTNDKNKNSKLVNVIKSVLSDLKNEIKNMGKEEKERRKTTTY